MRAGGKSCGHWGERISGREDRGEHKLTTSEEKEGDARAGAE